MPQRGSAAGCLPNREPERPVLKVVEVRPVHQVPHQAPLVQVVPVDRLLTRLRPVVLGLPHIIVFQCATRREKSVWYLSTFRRMGLGKNGAIR